LKEDGMPYLPRDVAEAALSRFDPALSEEQANKIESIGLEVVHGPDGNPRVNSEGLPFWRVVIGLEPGADPMAYPATIEGIPVRIETDVISAVIPSGRLKDAQGGE
jgi:hypothetical protein